MPPPSPFTLRTGIYPAIDPKQFEGSLDGKIALVTGSGRGIGKEIALAIAKAGASIAITGRTKSEVEETTRNVLEKGGSKTKAIGIVADACKSQDMIELVKEVEKELGQIDILICNAGTNTFMPFHLTDADSWWFQMELMVKSPVELTRLVLPSMKARNTGTIIYTSSRAASADLPWTTAYNCAKTAITRFAGSLQAELNALQEVEGRGGGIDVFSIHPGEIKTDLHETAFPEKTKKEAPYVIEFMDKISKGHPVYEGALPAWTCVYLCTGMGGVLRGRLVDCTRDLEEVKKHVVELGNQIVTNSCG